MQATTRASTLRSPAERARHGESGASSTGSSFSASPAEFRADCGTGPGIKTCNRMGRAPSCTARTRLVGDDPKTFFSCGHQPRTAKSATARWHDIRRNAAPGATLLSQMLVEEARDLLERVFALRHVRVGYQAPCGWPSNTSSPDSTPACRSLRCTRTVLLKSRTYPPYFVQL